MYSNLHFIKIKFFKLLLLSCLSFFSFSLKAGEVCEDGSCLAFSEPLIKGQLVNGESPTVSEYIDYLNEQRSAANAAEPTANEFGCKYKYTFTGTYSSNGIEGDELTIAKTGFSTRIQFISTAECPEDGNPEFEGEGSYDETPDSTFKREIFLACLKYEQVCYWENECPDLYNTNSASCSAQGGTLENWSCNENPNPPVYDSQCKIPQCPQAYQENLASCSSQGGQLQSWSCSEEPLIFDYQCEIPSETDIDKNKGPDCSDGEGNPCSPGSGNKFESFTDYKSANGKLLVTRNYNSLKPSDGNFGLGWTSQVLSSLKISRSDIAINSKTGRVEKWGLEYRGITDEGDGGFNEGPSILILIPIAPIDTRVELSISNEGYSVKNTDNSIDNFSSTGVLLSSQNIEGLITEYSYDDQGRLSKVTDSYGRTLSYQYNTDDHISSIETPDGTISYSYDGLGNLIQVTYPDFSTEIYHYENPTFPHALTGITDENNVRFATWTYNADGRVASSEHAGTVEKTTFSYTTNASNDITETTVTGALGDVRTYNFNVLNGVNKVVSVTGDQCTTCGNGFMKNREYNNDGFISSYIDWNGNDTRIRDNSRGLVTSKVEYDGNGRSAQEIRRTTTEWHDDLRLPILITRTNHKEEFTYTSGGKVLTRTVTDLASNESRTTTYTYHGSRSDGAGLLASMDGPRTDISDITYYEYDAQGNLRQTTNALGHIIQITSHDASGRPLTIIDANGTTTNLTWDLRGRLTQSVFGGQAAIYTYDPVGQLTRVTRPDGSYLNYTYDDAHRLTEISDNLGHKISYTLDKMGNRLSTETSDVNGVISSSQTAVFDKLSRLKQMLGAEGQQETASYDDNHNLISNTDVLSRQTLNHYDGLDRLIKNVDPDAEETNLTYDAQDNLTKVTDARGLETTYIYNGFDEVISQTSPDTGTTTYTYDSAGNVTSMTDARGVTVNYSYDALNRLSDIDYTNNTLDVTHSYDDGSNGIGRLTNTVDESGTTTYNYDARGNLLSKTLVKGTSTDTISYSYNGANRLIGMAYPSGSSLQYTLASNGEIRQITTTINGETKTILSDTLYQPFGPIKSFTYGNELDYTASYDASLRLTGQSTESIQSNIYDYNTVDNLVTFTNSLDNTLDQQFNYNNLDRLETANGNYGDFQYVFDVVGNRTQKSDGTNTDDYNYAATSHHLENITGSNAITYQYDDNGNTIDNGTFQFIYDQDNRLHRVMQGTTEIATYTYNSRGQRSSKTVDGITTDFFYDEQGQLIAEINPTASKEYIFFNNQPIAIHQQSSDGATTVSEILLDNTDANFSDNWPISTSIAGYQGDNYQTHAGATVAGPGVLGTPIDNDEVIFTDNWPNSSTIAGHLGNNYQFHAGTTAGVGTLGTPIDNLQATYTGTWPKSTSVKQFYSTNYQFHAAGTGANTATWDAGITVAGDYDIYINWAAHPNRASNAKFTINHSTGSDTQSVNQKINGAQWNLLGSYTLDGSSTISLSDDADGYVIADAVSILPAGTPTTVTQPQGETATWTLNPTITQSYDVYVTWTAHSNRASNAQYTINHSTGSDTVTVNQKQNGGQWNLLGTYTLDASSSVDLSSVANGYVIADGISILPEGTTPTITPVASETATWTPNQTGEFEVYANWSAHPNRASDAKYTINHSTGSDTITVDQKVNGGQWNLLGTYNLETTSTIELSADANGYVIADGIRLVNTASDLSSGLYYVHNNHLGTPEVVTDQSQTVAWKASYTPYGEATITTNTITNNVRLPGQYYDSETGLHYNYFRYYDPKLGRYVTSDPIGLSGGINTYGYVLGNPISYVDPQGLKTYISYAGPHPLITINNPSNPSINGTWNFGPNYSPILKEKGYFAAWMLGIPTPGIVTSASSPGLFPRELYDGTDYFDTEIYKRIMDSMLNPPEYSWSLNNCIEWTNDITRIDIDNIY